MSNTLAPMARSLHWLTVVERRPHSWGLIQLRSFQSTACVATKRKHAEPLPKVRRQSRSRRLRGVTYDETSGTVDEYQLRQDGWLFPLYDPNKPRAVKSWKAKYLKNVKGWKEKVQTRIKTAGAVEPATPTAFRSPGNSRDETALAAPNAPVRNVSFASLSPEIGGVSLREDVLEGLVKSGLKNPTNVQMRVIPEILSRKSVIINAETGSGKTIAFLAPILSLLVSDTKDAGLLARRGSPRGLILSPSAELASQTYDVARPLLYATHTTCLRLFGGTNRAGPRKVAQQSAYDMVMATPGRLVDMVDEGTVNFNDLSYLVVDEIDALMDGTYGTQIGPLMNAFQERYERGELQVVVAGATMPAAVLQELQRKRFLGLKLVKTGTSGRLLPNVREQFLSVVDRQAKIRALLGLIRANPSDIFMVFCNSSDSAHEIEKTLKRHITADTLALMGSMPPRVRAAKLAAFMNLANTTSPAPRQNGDRGKEHVHRVLICTDLASRGLDVLPVNHVVNVDFPKNPLDYVHRVGRTGRAGTMGRATSLVTKAEQEAAAALVQAKHDGMHIVDELYDAEPEVPHVPPQHQERASSDRIPPGAVPIPNPFVPQTSEDPNGVFSQGK
eukprot:Clim_evm28s229 gene=Clim_evmTU28s229